MERSHVQFVTERYPGAVGKVFLLSRYARVHEFVDIEDPAGTTGRRVYRMKREVHAALNGALKRMREEGLVAKAAVRPFARQGRRADASEETAGSHSPGAPSLLLEEIDADYVEAGWRKRRESRRNRAYRQGDTVHRYRQRSW